MQRRARFLLAASLASFASVATLGCSRDHGAAASPAETASELKALTIDQVAEKIAAKDGKTFLFDNNSKGRWARGHLPGAVWLDDENVTAADLPADKTAFLIFYCHNEG